ncbi:class I SAM-dependent methyltransferase [Tropicibacter oceani]|uniref:Class I SAM-dependent methyltransferase n=1 Tax=Tropicibacter oceani TaxID=3058420 RepID=A0ABY8QPJ9_9RHOB|nr:class I SAM-dependent methyltransferase [Tropicibacter oceani]WGW05757.1 class I SAM-dependent methyltransferase [Tropicibacter oceani]
MTALSDQTRAIYDREAQRYDLGRNRSLFERPWLDRALADVPKGGAVLDLGCGAGEPIGRYLVDQGYDVTGADFSQAMLAIFRSRLPQARAVLADMRQLDLGQSFDAIIGWGSFFHLTAQDQRAALPRIAAHLAPGGRLLLTVGPEAGEAIGSVGRSQVYHASLGHEDYVSILSNTECRTEEFAPNDAGAQGHSLLLARRNPC